jgi:hypothetical protein
MRLMQPVHSGQANHPQIEICMPRRVSFRLVSELRILLVNCRGIIQCFVSARTSRMDWLKYALSMMTVVVLLSCSSAFGAHITMTTSFYVFEKPEGLMLRVTAENRGDVPAHDVQLEVILDDKVLIGPVENRLDIGEKTSMKFSLAGAFGIPGRYPVVVRTNYKDAAGYRFTALTVGFHDYQSTVKPAVSISGQAARIPVDGEGRMTFVLRNDGQTAKKIDVALLIPNELSVSDEHSVIEIGPQQEQTLVYKVENYSALANSSYPVSLLGRYQENGKRFSMAGSAVVRIAGNVKSVASPIWVWILLGGLMPVIIILRLMKRWK